MRQRKEAGVDKDENSSLVFFPALRDRYRAWRLPIIGKNEKKNKTTSVDASIWRGITLESQEFWPARVVRSCNVFDQIWGTHFSIDGWMCEVLHLEIIWALVVSGISVSFDMILKSFTVNFKGTVSLFFFNS